MDDILIYSENLKHHRKIVWEVLSQLLKYDLYLKLEKCVRMQPMDGPWVTEDQGDCRGEYKTKE